MIKPAYSVSFLLSINIFVWQNVLYFLDAPRKIPDLLDFFNLSGISPSYTQIQPSYDLSSDHSPITITLGTTIADWTRPLRLHTFNTAWNTCKTKITEKLNTKRKLKTKDDREAATTELICILQQAAKTATQPGTFPPQ